MKKMLIPFALLLTLLLAGCQTEPPAVSEPPENSASLATESAVPSDTSLTPGAIPSEIPTASDAPDLTTPEGATPATSKPPKAAQPPTAPSKPASTSSSRPVPQPTAAATATPESGASATTAPKPTSTPKPTPTPEPTAVPTPAPKSAYDYPFDKAQIKRDMIAKGKSMGLTHRTKNDDGSAITPDNSNGAQPVTGTQSFQGAALKKVLMDYVGFHTQANIGAYGGGPIQYFTIYSIGNTFYFLY